MAFGDYQLEIYLQGLSGIVPSLPMAFADWETKAEGRDAAIGVVVRRRRGRGRAHPTRQS